NPPRKAHLLVEAKGGPPSPACCPHSSHYGKPPEGDPSSAQNPRSEELEGRDPQRSSIPPLPGSSRFPRLPFPAAEPEGGRCLRGWEAAGAPHPVGLAASPSCSRPQGSEVTIFRAGSGYSRVEGYPRPLQEELGLPGVDAAFTCPQASDLYVFQGNSMKLVDLQRSPRLPGPALATPHDHVDSAFCTAQGVFLFQGPNFYHYRSVDHLLGAPGPVPAQNTAADVFWCPMARGKGAPPRPTPQT
uniref:Hemopexin n=1 Tax=Podarcis muralis TaxID=64176 RepID=A0A670HUS1_PODMU